MFKLKGFSKKERSWILYDIANSAYILTVVTVLFPIYYQGVAADVDNRTTIFSFVTAGIALIVALLSPIIGSLANYRGNKMKFFKLFLGIGIIGGFGLVIPGFEMVALLAFFSISSIGYSLSNVIYDAFLMDVTTDDRMDNVSSSGYAWGYIGSMVPFAIAIIPFALVTFGILDASYEYLSVAFAFVISLVWWFVYSIPLIKDVEQTYVVEKSEKPIRDAFKNLAVTFSHIKKFKNIFVFLIAFLLYNDVVNTVIRLATTIGSDLGVGDSVLLGVVVLVQLIAFPSAIIYGRMADKFGSKTMIYYGIIVYAITVVVASFITEDATYLMWVVGILVGSAQGGIQGISRSYFAKMVPAEKANEFFGFFSVFGRFSGIFSPFLIGFVSLLWGTNVAVITLLIPLTISVLLLVFVHVDEQKKENETLEKENII